MSSPRLTGVGDATSAGTRSAHAVIDTETQSGRVGSLPYQIPCGLQRVAARRPDRVAARAADMEGVVPEQLALLRHVSLRMILNHGRLNSA